MSECDSIYLVGFMCSGKTTLGSRLAERLGRPFVDLDALVEARAGAKVASLWSERGESGFRALEAAALAEIAGRRQVVATGGGTPLDPGSRASMLSTGTCLWLRVPFAVLWRRAGAPSARVRPLWRDEASLRLLFEERERVYRFAHHEVNLGDCSVEEAVDRLLKAARMESTPA